MIQFILYFLSKFSVKIKVAFLIIFLISGILFWNVSYLKDTVIENKKIENSLNAFSVAEKLNLLVYSLQKERAYSVAVLNDYSDKKILKKIRLSSDAHMLSLKLFSKDLKYLQDKRINKKLKLIDVNLKTLIEVRSSIDAKTFNSKEVVDFYTVSLIKHIIDIIDLITINIESNDLNAYFNLISAIEYMSLEYDLVQVAITRDGRLNQIWYDFIFSNQAKSKMYINRFETFTEPNIMQEFYKLYGTSYYINLSKTLETIKAQAGFKIKDVDAKEWLSNYELYISDIKDVEKLNTKIVQNKIESLQNLNEIKYKNSIWILVIPLFFAFLIATFVFIDIKQSLNTLLDFLKEKGSDKRNEVLLLQSKSELGAVFRTLFAFNKKIKEQIEVIERTYETDQLTSIPNRHKLLKEMEYMHSQGHDFTVIYIDIHNFSHINDSFGQNIGDIYLQETANILKQIAGSISSDSLLETSIFRMGSDEFVLVCSHAQYINLLINKLKEIYIIKHKEIEMPLSFTFGIASSDASENQSSILSHAEIASRFAIRNHKRYEFYDENAHVEKRHKSNLEWVKKIAQAFSDGLFAVHFQAIADAKTKKVIKYEVLIRMYDKEKEIMISPAKFLSILQNSGHEKELTKLIIEQSFKYYEICQIDLSINMTGDDLDDEMLDYLIVKTKEHKINPSSIVVELVESEELLNEKYINIIHSIKQAGFKVAIDDFGTGYSNFSYLTQIKPNYIKIDGSLVQGINTNKEQYQIVSGIYNFAKNLGIEVIAEYVSDEDIYETIKEIGIEYVQGYHIGYVMSCDEIKKLRQESNK